MYFLSDLSTKPYIPATFFSLENLVFRVPTNTVDALLSSSV